MSFMQRTVDTIEQSERLDPVSSRVRSLIEPLVGDGRRRNLLTGRWLGHPAHPMIVVVPMGCWIASGVLDIAGGPGSRRLARRLIGLGVVAAAPAAATGAADWFDTDGAEQRVGIAHALANDVAVVAFAASWVVRRLGNQRVGRILSGAGAVSVAAAGYLGGHLAYVRGVGVNTTSFQSGPEEWTTVCAADDLPDSGATHLQLGNLDLAVVGDPLAVLEDRCTHRGGPLSEGDVEDDCIVCPWHGSRFSTRNGAVRSGPASVPQPVYESRLRDGMVQVRRAEFGELRRRPVGARMEEQTDATVVSG